MRSLNGRLDRLTVRVFDLVEDKAQVETLKNVILAQPVPSNAGQGSTSTPHFSDYCMIYGSLTRT